jgi:hypothetical protein
MLSRQREEFLPTESWQSLGWWHLMQERQNAAAVATTNVATNSQRLATSAYVHGVSCLKTALPFESDIAPLKMETAT